jgi:Ca-activated chloride channel family protein
MPIPMAGGETTHFDEKPLRTLSAITGGKFYRATSSGILWDRIRDIDQLEKSGMEVKRYHEYSDKAGFWIFTGAILFLTEIFLRAAVYRKVP